MKVTKIASDQIIFSMMKEGLDPNIFSINLELVDGALGFSFTDEKIFGKKYEFYGLRFYVDERVNVDDMLIDLVEVEGRVGLIFKKKE